MGLCTNARVVRENTTYRRVEHHHVGHGVHRRVERFDLLVTVEVAAEEIFTQLERREEELVLQVVGFGRREALRERNFEVGTYIAVMNRKHFRGLESCETVLTALL